MEVSNKMVRKDVFSLLQNILFYVCAVFHTLKGRQGIGYFLDLHPFDYPDV